MLTYCLIGDMLPVLSPNAFFSMLYEATPYECYFGGLREGVGMASPYSVLMRGALLLLSVLMLSMPRPVFFEHGECWLAL